MSNKLFIGSHVGMASPDYYLGTVKEAISYGATTFMFYTGAPQNLFRKPTKELKIKEGRELLKENGFDESKIIVHAPYIINIGNATKQDTWLLGVNALIQELNRVNDFGLNILVLHPGAHVGAGEELGLQKIVDGLNIALATANNKVKIALETMAGKGSELGTNISQLKFIIENVKFQDRIGVCIDTCHLNDSGEFKNGFDDYLDRFDKEIGINKILCVHLNDSKNSAESHKDRHENLGYGYVGFDFINSVLHNPRLEGVPMCLETPYINEKPPYKEEISMLVNNKFIPDWRDNF